MNLAKARSILARAASRARWAKLKTPAARRKATAKAREKATTPEARAKAERTKAEWIAAHTNPGPFIKKKPKSKLLKKVAKAIGSASVIKFAGFNGGPVS